MARRSFKRRRSYRPRRSYRSRKYFRMRKKREIKRFKRNLVRTAEKKYVYSSTSGAVSSSGTVSSDLVTIPQGDTDNQRNGDQVDIRSLRIGYKIAIDGATPDSYNQLRIMIVQVKDSLYVPAFTAGTSVLHDSNNPQALFSPYSHDNRYRFRVLYDKTHTVVLGSNGDGPTPAIIRKANIRRFWRRRIQFGGGGSTPNVGSIFMMAISDSGVISHPTLYFSYKLNYSDP